MNAKPFLWIHAATNSGSLSSVDRINEVLFGLIMVLTFTCSISAATAGREELSTILWSALGCNLAWGFVDAVMYLFSVLLERGETFATIRTIRNAATEADAIQTIKELIPSFIAHVIKEEDLAGIADRVRKLPEPPQRVVLTPADLRKALAIFLLVFLSTFPVTTSVYLDPSRSCCDPCFQHRCPGFAFSDRRLPGQQNRKKPDCDGPGIRNDRNRAGISHDGVGWMNTRRWFFAVLILFLSPHLLSGEGE